MYDKIYVSLATGEILDDHTAAVEHFREHNDVAIYAKDAPDGELTEKLRWVW